MRKSYRMRLGYLFAVVALFMGCSRDVDNENIIGKWDVLSKNYTVTEISTQQTDNFTATFDKGELRYWFKDDGTGICYHNGRETLITWSIDGNTLYFYPEAGFEEEVSDAKFKIEVINEEKMEWHCEISGNARRISITTVLTRV